VGVEAAFVRAVVLGSGDRRSGACKWAETDERP
jgi:hypothetical protein